MREHKPLKLKTKREKETASNIIRELIPLIQLFEMVSKSRWIDERRWSEGYVFGMKYFIMRVAKMLDDPQKEKLYKELVKWEEEKKPMKKPQSKSLHR
jgi:hypothetical protein